jgi:hypothetical protein
VTGLVSVARSGNVWTIASFTGSGSTDAEGFRNLQQSSPYVFGTPYQDPRFGLTIRAPNGSLRADLSRRPLAIAQRVVIPANAMSAPMTRRVNAAVIVGFNERRLSSASMGPGSPFYVIRIWRRGLYQDETNGRLMVGEALYQKLENEDAPLTPEDDRYKVTALIVDTTGL